MKDKPGLPEAKWAALRLIALPEKYEDFTTEQKEFMKSNIIGELLDGKWPEAMRFTGGITQWKKKLTNQ